MQWKSNVVRQGGSTYILVPRDLVEYLELQIAENEVIIEDKIKSKGKFIAVWKNPEKLK